MTRQSISRLISRRAVLSPDEPLVVSSDGHGMLTADQLDRAGNRLARDYRARGVGLDDLVTVAMPTSLDFVVACTAIWKLGATPQPIAPDLDITERGELERLDRPALVLGTRPCDPAIPWLSAGHRTDSELLDTQLPDAWSSCWKAPTSSGSTGRPKIVRATAPALFDPDDAVAPFLPHRATQLVTSPLWHSASFTYAFRGLMTDHRLVLADEFDEHTFADVVERHRITWTLMSPSMIHRLVRLPAETLGSHDMSSVESVLHMGAPCPADAKRALIAWLGADRVYEVYAGSESNGLTMIRGDEWLARPGSVGRGIGGTAIAIRDHTGRDVDVGVEGQVWMHRDGDPRYSYVGGKSHRIEDGWDTLGDIGFLDADGYLTIVGRESDAIGCGETQVYPARLEQGIVAHPAVRDAVVYRTHDAAGAPRIGAVLDIGDSDIDPRVVERFAVGHLERFCRTGGVTVGRRPLRNAAGKVRRGAIAARETAAETCSQHGIDCVTTRCSTHDHTATAHRSTDHNTGTRTPTEGLHT